MGGCASACDKLLPPIRTKTNTHQLPPITAKKVEPKIEKDKDEKRGCVFYFESVSVVFFQIFLRLPICTKTDSECTAHRDLFHVSRKYFCFPKKAPAAAIFNYLNKIFGKHTRGKKQQLDPKKAKPSWSHFQKCLW